ncbi:RND transporter [Bradyrhizobium retamae]|uniref:RND transporter n=1 Tax=Bradyrhizobium retamae TaxID=1300035 RepID=A0A0R3MQU8_9BRAD|nr:RND transporter [Bradyrhizobium retamae]
MQALRRCLRSLRDRRSDLAFGIERIGLLSLRFPTVVACVAAALVVIAGFGIPRIRIDDSLSQLFRSDTPQFKQYELESHRFPSSEFDVLVVVEGKSLLERASLDRLRNLVTDLQLIDGTRGVISLFSAREPPTGGQPPAPLVPDQLPQGEAYQKLVSRITSNEIIRGKLLSTDGDLALVVLALDPHAAQGDTLAAIVQEIRTTADRDLTGTGLKASLTGVPVMQLEIRHALERDRIIYNAAGFAAGCLIAMLFFRRASFMAVAAGPPLIAILLGLGALGWLGFKLNIFLNVMTPLIMVISFSDSMQLTFLARDRMIAGKSRYAAFRDAITVVGPACVLTHGTAALSFIALQFTQSDLIRAFGKAGLIATAIALVTVLLLVPLFGIILVRDEAGLAEKARRADRAVDSLRLACGWIAGRIVSRPGLYTLLGLIAVIGFGSIYTQLQPRYRLSDQVPDRGQAVAAAGRLDSELTGSNPINVMIQFPKGASLYAPQTLDAIAEVHGIMERQRGISNVWSLETLRRWLARTGEPDAPTLKRYVDILPRYLVRRFVSADQDAVVVAGRVPDIDASQIRPIVGRALGAVRMQHPGYTISVTSLSAIAARNSARMIEKLNRGLTVEAVFVAAFIGLAFRSVQAMLASILPAVFPIVVAGSLLWMLGDGLQFASVVALTVSFGLGLSATIHFLNRLRLEELQGDGSEASVKRATILVGPAMILTSVVLSCGLIVTVFSNLPALRMFGWLSTFAMVLALIADLTILRPTITFLRLASEWAGRGRQ